LREDEVIAALLAGHVVGKKSRRKDSEFFLDLARREVLPKGSWILHLTEHYVVPEREGEKSLLVRMWRVMIIIDWDKMPKGGPDEQVITQIEVRTQFLGIQSAEQSHER